MSDIGQNNIQIYSPFAADSFEEFTFTGTLLGTIHGGKTKFKRAEGVALGNDDGALYVVNNNGNSLQMFTDFTTSGGNIPPTLQIKTRSSRLNFPVGVAVANFTPSPAPTHVLTFGDTYPYGYSHGYCYGYRNCHGNGYAAHRYAYIYAHRNDYSPVTRPTERRTPNPESRIRRSHFYVRWTLQPRHNRSATRRRLGQQHLHVADIALAEAALAVAEVELPHPDELLGIAERAHASMFLNIRSRQFFSVSA